MDGELGWWGVGALALWYGLRGLDSSRQEGSSFARLFLPVIAGVLALNYGATLREDGLTLVPLALWFCAVSPLLALLGWGRGFRRVLLWLLRAAVGLFLGLIAGALLVGKVEAVLLLGLIGFTLAVLPFGHWRKRRRQNRFSRPSGGSPSADAELKTRLAAVERSAAVISQERERLAARLRVLEEGQVDHTRRLEEKRREIREQVARVRSAEVARLRACSGIIAFDPHYGFLMAEGWRVLRAELAAGERLPAIEHDGVFHQVVAELLRADDFEARYFHRAARAAMTVVNGFLAGEVPISAARDQLRALRLEPHQLALRPLTGDPVSTLLEAWLVPLRRWQRRQWERFEAGEHPRQEEIAAEFAARGLPAYLAAADWQALWDEQPRLFTEQSVAPSRS